MKNNELILELTNGVLTREPIILTGKLQNDTVTYDLKGIYFLGSKELANLALKVKTLSPLKVKIINLKEHLLSVFKITRLIDIVDINIEK